MCTEKRCTRKNWFTWLWRLASPKSAVWASSLENHEDPCSTSSLKPAFFWIRKNQHHRESPKAVFWRILSCLWEAGHFALVRPSTDWVRLTHTREGNLLYTNSTNLNVVIPQNTLTETPRVTFAQISGHPVTQPNWHIKITITGTSKIRLK